jgi:hypothetical protein
LLERYGGVGHLILKDALLRGKDDRF